MNIEKIVVLVNSKANSSKVDQEGLNAAVAHVNKYKPCQLVYTTSIEDYVAKVKDYSADEGCLVAVAGGDGTINLGLNAITKGAPIAFIPTGTANVIAKELGIPSKILDSFKLLLTGALQKIDLGVCNNTKFGFVTGIGFDAVCAHAVSKQLKTYLGQAAYAVAAVKTILTYKPARLKIEADNGQVVEGDFAIFLNMRRYGGELYFDPEARHDDGILNLVLLKDFSFFSLIKLVKYAHFGGKFPEKVALKIQAKSFKVTASEPTMYELDGEVFGPEKDFVISVDPASQQVMTI